MQKIQHMQVWVMKMVLAQHNCASLAQENGFGSA
jgi:uncharacterized protein YbaP (TraB family)